MLMGDDSPETTGSIVSGGGSSAIAGVPEGVADAVGASLVGATGAGDGEEDSVAGGGVAVAGSSGGVPHAATSAPMSTVSSSRPAFIDAIVARSCSVAPQP